MIALTAAVLLNFAAAGASEKQPDSVTGKTETGEKVVCKVTKSTESRLARKRNRVCLTQAEWDELADENRDMINRSGAAQRPRQQ